MTGGPEWTDVEQPLLDQLAAMGWRTLCGSASDPSVTGRESFREVFLGTELREAIRRINLRDGQPWLDDDRVSHAVSSLERIGHRRLIEANQEATDLLLGGVQVEGLPGWDGGRAQTVHFIDWDHPERNTFTAVNQFKVDCPGGQSKGSIRPDVTLFVNGIPIVVVECKSPTSSEPVTAAVDQLRRYHNARKHAGECEENEGNERLFYTNQFLIATSYDEARVGTIGAEARYYLEWKDTAPVPLADVQRELGKERLSSQHTLVAGMLRPAHLLDIIRHFTLYQQSGGRTVKIVCRYQQFRAVHAAVDRLLHGKTRQQDGEHDRRGGIVWHTQGSGKSLTMVFLVRKMRSLSELRRFKIVVVTDRKDLERQLSDTATLTGETVERARRVREVKTLLRRKGPGIVFAMIQKYQDRDLEERPLPNPLPQAGEGTSGADDAVGDLGLLNDDEAILVMVDEAHRSHSSALHGHLLQALPNCARIGFTGTPIIMGAKKRTHEIFGEFLDRYTIRQAEQDGATVPILYEGRTVSGAVADGRDLDELFEDLFQERSEEERKAIQRKYGTRGSIFEAEKLIQAKARDMLWHYVENILPSGLKAQVVAYSRRAAVRYQAALTKARDELVQAALELDEATRRLDDLELDRKPRATRAAVRAWRVLGVLRRLEFAAIISAENNQLPELNEWSDAAKIESRIARFKKPLPPMDVRRAADAAADATRKIAEGEPDYDVPATLPMRAATRADGASDNSDPLAFLIVKSMLLTGFDAPIEGVMYLDRPIREAELLQAIARVNRTGHGKSAGILVDYYGVAGHLRDALAAYSAEDIEGALQSLKDEIPTLRDRHARVVDLFHSHGVDDITDTDAAVYLLADERLRAEFSVKLKQFLATLDLVLPRPEGLPFVKDAEQLGEIYELARKKYRIGLAELGKDVGRKVQRLIDEHVISLGIDPRIPPIAITDSNFAKHIRRQVSDRAKASEMEHAVRSHIRKKIDEDPVHYQKLSERLEEILHQFGEDWKQLALALEDFVDEVVQGRGDDAGCGLDPQLHAPFFDLLRQERERDTLVGDGDAARLAEQTVEMVDRLIRPSIAVVDFWKNATRQDELRGQLFRFLDESEIIDFDRLDAATARLMELSRANHDKLVKSE
ncbi:type I restriction endonuclease subunit R [Candidatus Laterigemmans baculatus]|nr:type I restriction endonuclease subunit R [Candidatus Laterigemmans baculatus]